MRLKRKDLLGIEDLERDEIELILATAESFKEVSEREIKKVPTLRGRTIINLFYEASTRTRTSFEIAAKRMSADAVNISVSSSSVVKGETLRDTAKNLEAMRPDCIVIRHSSSGTPGMLSKYLACPVVNAGDGAHEHPSQALLDMLTVKEKKGTIEGLKVSIIGDITHSRVARSNIYGFTKMGAEVTVAGPPTMLPAGIEKLGCRATSSMDEAIRGADVVMMLRIQIERQSESFFPSVREYSRLYGLDETKLKAAKDDVVILHPGPINRGVEISTEVADGPYSVILDQVTNGVAVRMAIFYHLLGGAKEEHTEVAR
ncbi:MAG TPA: aspartate carbamoyltransferase [Deltaproteobacteria bacterium]|nr:MAG: aspartate carbamoyltransferase [Deltaproteobacteria bacterium GWA2_55_82]OGQ63247.1 MAG: aspartate carbamoyltransferase [Deltaproteobacteria bacterium RIFCSPLOWO2_02_FULL_55_12]OIJ73082.1 MAG: aspartate carbamoyltransferase [Deltaproteobacteria bacterium GWC2_55_46]HBG47844.1 aspartate carbamoyltransferase [Deltaproteobacteria bacterium]HCY11893.1 aspartate carbamoyltransferase [Deltaproteobacteria bacterium]